MDILKGKRYDIMNVLWEEGRPLSAFEINDIAPELKMPTVRRCLELLLKENLIQVAGTSMNGKVYARNYTPLLSREDYLKGNAKSSLKTEKQFEVAPGTGPSFMKRRKACMPENRLRSQK